jgi:hypothetical protein
MGYLAEPCPGSNRADNGRRGNHAAEPCPERTGVTEIVAGVTESHNVPFSHWDRRGRARHAAKHTADVRAKEAHHFRGIVRSPGREG